MKNNIDRIGGKPGSVSLIEIPAIIKKIEDSPGWKKEGRRRKKRTFRISMKEWNLPEQEEGYIKARKNDFL